MVIKRFRFSRAINFRDMGGIFTDDGKMFGWNKIYRSDKFAGTKPEEWDIMRKQGIKTIIDLRSESEVEVSSDETPDDFEYINFPVVEENLSFNNLESPAMQAFAQRVGKGYRNIVLSHGENIAQIINLIADKVDNGGVVFHCTSGKDRTGVIAAALYYMFGMCEEDIVADYQTSYTYNKKASDKFLEDFPQYEKYRSVVLSEAENMYELLDLYKKLDIEKYLIEKGMDKNKLEHLKKSVLE